MFPTLPVTVKPGSQYVAKAPTHALTLTATQPIARIDSNSIPAFRRVVFKRQIENFCVDSIYSSLAKFNVTPLRHIVNQA